MANTDPNFLLLFLSLFVISPWKKQHKTKNCSNIDLCLYLLSATLPWLISLLQHVWSVVVPQSLRFHICSNLLRGQKSGGRVCVCAFLHHVFKLSGLSTRFSLSCWYVSSLQFLIWVVFRFFIISYFDFSNPTLVPPFGWLSCLLWISKIQAVHQCLCFPSPITPN